MKWRAEYDAIINKIPEGSRVLDIGCGEGDLLLALEEQKKAIVRGLEIRQDGVNACVAKGLAVIQGDADKDLGMFPDDSFDYVILSNTIQATMHPKDILLQIKRIGKVGIVALPNFGYWQMRVYLLLNGRMPVTKDLPDTWYDTRNIHFCTLKDFEILATECGFNIRRIIPIHNNICKKPIKTAFGLPNLFSERAVYVLERAQEEKEEVSEPSQD